MNNISGPVSLIKKSFEIFFKKENFVYFLKIQAPLLPLAVISFLWSLVLMLGASKLPENLSTNPVVIFSTSIASLLNSIIYIFVIIASYSAIKSVLEGSQLPISEAFLIAKNRVWKYALTGMLKGIILFLGFILFIIPGIVFSVWFAFSGIEIAINGVGVREALSKSKALIKGRFWAVLERLAVFIIFTSLLQILLITLPIGIGSIISPVLGILFILPAFLLYRELAGRG